MHTSFRMTVLVQNRSCLAKAFLKYLDESLIALSVFGSNVFSSLNTTGRLLLARISSRGVGAIIEICRLIMISLLMALLYGLSRGQFRYFSPGSFYLYAIRRRSMLPVLSVALTLNLLVSLR